MILTPKFFGFAAGGFERDNILQKFFFYSPFGAILGLISLKLILIITGNNKFKGAIIHDPDTDGIFSYGYSLKVIKNPIFLFIMSWLIFSSLFLLAVNENTFFNAIPVVEQQFTTTADIFFSMYPASPSETFEGIFFISLLSFFLSYFTQGKLSKSVYLFLTVIIMTIGGATFGYLNHLLRYGFNEVAIQNVILFWGFGGFITALIRSVIPFLVLHDVNNLFVKLNQLFSSDSVITYTVIVLIIGWLLFFI